MPPKSNPLRLNPLQLKTLVLFQALASDSRTSTPQPESGDVLITQFPHPHGDHFHLGDAIVLARDATGIRNEAVWRALERKGLIRAEFPIAVSLTHAGQAYETGIRDRVLHSHDH
jgi:hypothetical protein